MPLKKGKSAKTVSNNIKELIDTPANTRKKAIATIAKTEGISPKKAKQKQAIAIALSMRSKK